VTSSGKALSVLFNSLRLESNPGDVTLHKQAVVTFLAPAYLARDEGLIGVAADLRGHIARSAGVRARIFFAVGNGSQTIELAAGESFSAGQATLDHPLSTSVFDLERLPSEAQTGKPSQPPMIAVTLFVEVQKTNYDDSFLATVDSLDLALATDPQAVMAPDQGKGVPARQ
jgi:hypothetical protein